MTQEIAVEKIIASMQSERMMSQELTTFITYYLSLVYAVGFDEGRVSTTKNRKKVMQIKNGVLIKIWNSETEASRVIGVNDGTINKAVIGKIKTCKGFEWRYV